LVYLPEGTEELPRARLWGSSELQAVQGGCSDTSSGTKDRREF
jgi:hypothetical protein